MMSESDIIDQVNPFLDEPSGTWSKPYAFALSTEYVEEKPMWEEPTDKDSCNVAATAGDNQIAWCAENIRKPNCPLHRNIEPTQRVDKDIEYPEDPGLFPRAPEKPKMNYMLFFVLFLLLVAIFIAFRGF